MALRYLLDTNICIYIAKQRPSAAARRFADLGAGTVGMSLITSGELRFGAEKSARRDETLAALVRLNELIPVIELGANVKEAYGALRAQMERAGTPVGNNDLWIASHALSLGVTRVSNNTREFARVPGLALENWAN